MARKRKFRPADEPFKSTMELVQHILDRGFIYRQGNMTNPIPFGFSQNWSLAILRRPGQFFKAIPVEEQSP